MKKATIASIIVGIAATACIILAGAASCDSTIEANADTSETTYIYSAPVNTTSGVLESDGGIPLYSVTTDLGYIQTLDDEIPYVSASGSTSSPGSIGYANEYYVEEDASYVGIGVVPVGNAWATFTIFVPNQDTSIIILPVYATYGTISEAITINSETYYGVKITPNSDNTDGFIVMLYGLEEGQKVIIQCQDYIAAESIEGIYEAEAVINFIRFFSSTYYTADTQGEITGRIPNGVEGTVSGLVITGITESTSTPSYAWMNEGSAYFTANTADDISYTVLNETSFSPAATESSLPLEYMTEDAETIRIGQILNEKSFAIYNSTEYMEGYTEGYAVGYTEGYSKGYEEGYSYGYDKGYTEGYDTGATEGLNFLDWIVACVNEFLEVQFFGTFSIGDLLMAAIAITVCVILLKMFAGG